MDLRSLNIFIEAAELGSFTRTGEKLGYSQPTVSFQIKQLEKELGVQLFDRIGHTVSLTDAGRDALRYAQNICHMSQEMILGSAQRREPNGVLRLGMADSLCAPLITGGFARFREVYPKVSLHVITCDTGALLEALDHNEVDMICTMDDHVYDTNYVIADEEEIGVHFVVSPKNELAGREQVGIEQLLPQPFLLTEKGMSYRCLMDEQLARNSQEIQPVLETGRADLICSLVEENAGIAFLPDYVTEESVRQGRLVRLDVPDFRIVVWKQVLYRREKWVSLEMQAMIDHMEGIRLIGEEA
ncbi:MAG: LysR family transcriptional regulator [Oscillospiraceae bacterium]|nr:LysR family transcriptional regulator [Oscillospiraceae bacterium]